MEPAERDAAEDGGEQLLARKLDHFATLMKANVMVNKRSTGRGKRPLNSAGAAIVFGLQAAARHGDTNRDA